MDGVSTVPSESAASPSPAEQLRQACTRLDELTSWERVDRSKMRVGLAPATDLLHRLGDPHRRFRSVHVTGTKGKGSVCALVEAGLTHAGFRVGRYASPHVHHISERVSLEGRPIGDQELAVVLDAVLDARDAAGLEQTPGAQATWFDVLTAAAFLAFARAKLELAVIEVGLGGRFDSTNVVESDVAVITNIGLEHTDALGDTIEKIAFEKAGIIKGAATVVTPIAAGSAAGRVIFEAARSVGAPTRGVPVPTGATISQENFAVARTVLNALGGRAVLSRARGGPMSAGDLPAEVAEAVRLPGRMERVRLPASGVGSGWMEVVLDGAHVDFAMAQVLRELRRHAGLQTQPVVLLALGADKNARAFATVLKGEAAVVVCTQVQTGRPGMDASVLAAALREVGLTTRLAESPAEGFARCRELAGSGWILVTGSFYLVSAIRGDLLTTEAVGSDL